MKDPRPTSRKEAVQAAHDLRQLQESPEFKQAILALKGDESSAIDLCYRFLVADCRWMRHVIRTWDGVAPLPRTDDPCLYQKAEHISPSAHDLGQLQKNQKFKQAVRALKRDVSSTLGLCFRFNILNSHWMEHVIRTWDGVAPLPRADDPSISYPKSAQVDLPPPGFDFKPIMLGVYHDGSIFDYSKGTKAYRGGCDFFIHGSPRLRGQSFQQLDPLGATWLTLRVRLGPGVNEGVVTEWVKGAFRSHQKSKKLSTEDIVFSFLDKNKSKWKGRPKVYALQKFLLRDCLEGCQRMGITLEKKTAGTHAKKWINKNYL